MPKATLHIVIDSIKFTAQIDIILPDDSTELMWQQNAIIREKYVAGKITELKKEYKDQIERSTKAPQFFITCRGPLLSKIRKEDKYSKYFEQFKDNQ